MVKVVTTISIDSEVKKEVKDLLYKKNITLSFFVEKMLMKFIEKEKGGKNGIWKEKESR